jgi:anti-anti-sigma factor
LAISLKNHQGYSVLTLVGKFTSANTAEIQKAAQCALGVGNKNFIMDFAKISVLDSDGLGCVMAVKKLFEGLGGKVCLASASSNILTLLNSCSASKVLTILPSLLEAEVLFATGIVKKEGGFYVLFKMPPEFNLAVVKPLRDALEESKKKGYSHFVFDFERCKIITSVGLGLLINLHKDLAGKNGGMYLLDLSAEVAAVLEATNLLSVLRSYKTLEEIDEEMMPKPL